jgi:hypothetical protein
MAMKEKERGRRGEGEGTVNHRRLCKSASRRMSMGHFSRRGILVVLDQDTTNVEFFMCRL